MMKRIFFIVLCLFLIAAQAQELKVMTYNLRLDVASDGDNAWPNRKEFLVSQIQFYEPDVFGTQEGLPHQINFMDSELEKYDFIGEGREGSSKGEYSAIFYNSGKVKLLKHATFWLSQTPEKVSKGWDAAYLRICTYGLFKDLKTKKRFLVFNTHLDNEGEVARNKGVALILKKILEINIKNDPVILTGDFNAAPESQPISSLKNKMADAKDICITKPFGPDGTFNGFKFCEPVGNRIDYVFVSNPKTINVYKYGVLTDSKNLKYPSDHFPVFVKLQFTNQ